MKATILNPIPWSVAMTADGAYHVTITAGPREAVKLIFPSRVHFGVFADILQSAAAALIQVPDKQKSARWESPALQAVRQHLPYTDTGSDPEKITQAALQQAGFTYDPKSGAWDFHKDALDRFSFPGRNRKPPR